MNTFFTLDIMTIADIGVTFSPNHVLIHSKPGKKLDSFHNRAYHNKRLCVLDCLKEYLKFRSTKVQTDTKALFITWQTFQGSSNQFNEKMGERSFNRNVYSKRMHPTHLQISCYQQSKPTECRHCRNFKTGLLEKSKHSLFFIRRTLYIMHQKMQTS